MMKKELVERLTLPPRGYWGAPIVRNQYVAKARERQIIEAARDHACRELVGIARSIRISDMEEHEITEETVGEWVYKATADMPSGHAVFLAFDRDELDALLEVLGAGQAT